MAETLYYLSASGLAELLGKLARDSRVYVPVGEELEYHTEPAEPAETVAWRFTAVRAVEPLKALLFPARQNTGAYFGAQGKNGEKLTNVLKKYELKDGG